MGGSGDYGGTSNYGGVGGGASDNTDCSQLNFLATPRLDPTVRVAIDDVFAVQLADDRVVELRDGTGGVVGTVIDNLVDLIRCLEAGQSYQADVTELKPAVVVRVAASAQ